MRNRQIFHVLLRINVLIKFIICLIKSIIKCLIFYNSVLFHLLVCLSPSLRSDNHFQEMIVFRSRRVKK